MALRASLVLSALYSVALLGCGAYSNAEDLIFQEVQLSSFLPSASCSPFKASGGKTIMMTNRHGPCFGTPPLTEQDKLAALAEDAARVAWVQKKLGGMAVDSHSLISESKGSSPLRNGRYIGTADHVVTVAYGTPARLKTVIFDTFDHLSWVLCKGCKTCTPQDEPLFDPDRSSSYRNVSCDSPMCPYDGSSGKGCHGGTCAYWGLQYGYSSFGFLARDTLRMSPDFVFRDILFGCSQYHSRNIGRTAGLLGFGHRNFTLNGQVAGRVGNVFSYCFPSTSSSTGFLKFGKPLKKPLGYTPMLADPFAREYYFIDLIGISVGGKRLPLSPSVFQLSRTAIESGTVNTYIPFDAYSALRTAFRSGMTQYPLDDSPGRFETCYDFSMNKTVVYPAIKLHFTGLDVEIPKSGVFQFIRPSKVCLAFIGTGSIGIIGSHTLKTYELTYDAGRQRFGFSRGACG